MLDRITVTDHEIAAHIAEAYVRRQSKYPRCDCDGNKQLERKWKEDAKADVCGFIKGQFGKEPRALDYTDKRAMKRDCAKFLPRDKMKMLESQRGRPSADFWANFCESTHTYKLLPQDKVLKLFKSMFPTPKNTKARTLTEIVMTPAQRRRVMSDALLMVRLDADTKRALDLFARSRMPKSSIRKISPSSTLPETEDCLLKQIKTMYRDPATNKLAVRGEEPSRVWRRIVREYGDKFPQAFLDRYSSELTKKKAGKKKRVLDPNTPIVSKPRKKKKVVKKLIPVNRAPNHDKLQQQQINDDTAQVTEVKKTAPVGKITTPERLNGFINNKMKSVDDSYALSTPISRWSNPEWGYVDSLREHIAPELLEKYAVEIDKARRILGIRSGGAYASIRGNAQLCVAHVTTAWLCGDLD